MPPDERSSGLYIIVLSLHGLIRGRDLELGRDADTGGQTKYVVDLVRELALHPAVEQVDLVTRLVDDPEVSPDYAQPEESLGHGARILRLQCGPAGYIAKEQLWDYLDTFADNLVQFLKDQRRLPDIVHSHYADAGYVGVRVSNLLGLPLVHTGHSLGRDKRKRLLARGVARERIESDYNISRRISAEEETLANADLVIASTNNEVEAQYGLYDYHDYSRMVVIAPGTDLQKFRPCCAGERYDFQEKLRHFLRDPEKPLILALSRPDERKNIITLIEAYGESPELQAIANLLIVVGNRDDIREMDDGPGSVLTNILLTLDGYDLYGKVALPKSHKPEEVPEIYRMVAAGRGVFINPALTEPFGLTLLEAAASGLPVVATENGGPVDIVHNLRSGKLVDPLDKADITEALLASLQDGDYWERASASGIEGVRKHYSWRAHVEKYVERLPGLVETHEPIPSERPVPASIRDRDRMIGTDLDLSLIGDPAALEEFVDIIMKYRKRVSFCIVTGRRIDSALAMLRKHGVPRPDVLISSMGTRIHYGPELTEDDWWAEHIDHHWSPRRIRSVLAGVPGLFLQEQHEQSPMKISYYYDSAQAPALQEVNAILLKNEITANTLLSFGQFLDVLPSRASKGQALRYVAQILDIPLQRTLVAGGSGGDEDMMRGNTLAVVVANRHNEELSGVIEADKIYLARRPYAGGILEAVAHYDFFGNCGRVDA